MDYEKLYKDALNRAKSAIEECGNNQGRITMIESIFPELKEPDDEKIRKQIISFLKEFEYDHYRNLDFSSWIAWLEKQDKSEGKYSVWVDGLEMNDNYLTKKEALDIARAYKKDGYNNTKIELIDC